MSRCLGSRRCCGERARRCLGKTARRVPTSETGQERRSLCERVGERSSNPLTNIPTKVQITRLEKDGHAYLSAVTPHPGRMER